MRTLLILIGIVFAHSALAEILVPVRTIRAKEIIAAEDLVFKNIQSPGALSSPEEVIGQEQGGSLVTPGGLQLRDV